ncbi:hypothetical protein VTI28DRAFT_4857 [Corynascus sepedonium]
MAISTKKQFPGFGLRIDHEEEDNPFPLAIGDDPWGSKGVTLREKRMLDFVNKITDKPDWEVKVFDETIVSRWRAEADVRPPDLDGDVYLSQQMFDFCIAELRDKSDRFKQTGRVNVLDSELTVIKSDRAISKETQDELRACVKVLEDVPDRLKDWHPGSDETVLDLVHPSLFPVVWGLTRALEEGIVPLDDCVNYTGKGVTVASWIPDDTPQYSYEAPKLWGSFQWLPAQVELAQDGSAKITSYINNLHPTEHKALYGVLERIVAATVPLWEDALNGFGDRRRFDISYTGHEDWTYPQGLKYRIPGRQGRKSLYEPNTETYHDADGVDDSNNNSRSSNENNEDEGDDDDWMYEEDYWEWQRNNRILKYREPLQYARQANLSRNKTVGSLRDDFPNGLQVIFKLANIHLTPEKPSYAGGSWHVEGTLNEMICASAIYYYDEDNITDSHLAFRQRMNTEEIMMIPEQNEHLSLERYLGVRQEGRAIQELGKVLTKEGRLLVFPNCLQHQVQPFELRDKTQPGHRKILAMFLVNPHRPVLSSAHVPPQRRDWWAQEVRRDGALRALPNEVVNMVVNEVDDFPISWDQALDIRERLMEERGKFNDRVEEFYEQEEFSFCEH